MGLSSPNSAKLEGVLKFQISHFYVKKAIAPVKLRMSCPRLGNLWWMGAWNSMLLPFTITNM